jgi:hypothetical protein
VVTDQKSVLQQYLQIGREVLLAKLDGVGEYDARRPMVPTGTNLLGVVKHVASVEAGYLGDCFGRPFEHPFPWFADDAESERGHVGHGRRVAGIDRRSVPPGLAALGRDDCGAGSRRRRKCAVVARRPDVTLQQILVHMIAETHRHAGQMDIVRELIDGEVGWKPGSEVMPDVDDAWWVAYRQRLELVAREVGNDPTR